MYLEHYRLKAKPFNLSPGPQFLWFGEKHEEALATLNYGIAADLGFLLLTGDVGVGKTALIHRLINNLDSSTIVAHITDPGLGTLDFFKLLAVEFNFANEFHSKGEFLIELERFLYKAHADHKKVLLIIDEAQRLNNKLLDQIRVLSNIELSDRKLINIFFIGQPEFKEMLAANSNRGIRQRIAINYHIDPLTESETGQYIEHRLKVAGATRKIFKSDAMHEIFRFTGGYPRAINIICDHALVTGFAFGLKSIDLDLIKECEQELEIRAGFDFRWTGFQTPADTTRPVTTQPVTTRFDTTQPVTPTPSPRQSITHMGFPILIGACILLGIMASFYLLWPEPIQTMTPITPKSLSDSSEPKDEIAEADRQAAISTDQAAPALDQPSDNIEADSAVPVPDAAEKDLAWPSAPSDAEPVIQAEKAAPALDPVADNNEADGTISVPDEAKKDLASLSAPSASEPEIQTEKATPAPDPVSDKSKVDSDVTVAVKVEKKQPAPLIAVLPDAKPSPKPDKGAQVSKAKKKTVPKKVSSGKRPEPPITAKAETQLQPATKSIGGTTPSDKQPDNNSLENRLRSFLQNYCNTYASKDLDAFTNLFVPDARENGVPFLRLLPKYQRNFTFIETIQYRIELQEFSYDDDREIAKIDGTFFLRWLPPDKKWRENSGKISMRLQEKRGSFLVQRLDYQGSPSKKE